MPVLYIVSTRLLVLAEHLSDGRRSAEHYMTNVVIVGWGLIIERYVNNAVVCQSGQLSQFLFIIIFGENAFLISYF